MSKIVLKMSKTYCYIGFKGWVVNILNTVLNNFYRKVEYTKCIIFNLSFLPNPKNVYWNRKKLYFFFAINCYRLWKNTQTFGGEKILIFGIKVKRKSHHKKE